MSLLLTKLQLGDNCSEIYNKEYLVTQMSYKFERGHNGRIPDSTVQCGSIELSIVAPGKEDLGLYEWYIDKSIYNGRIICNLSSVEKNVEQPVKVIKFENAYCFLIAQEYNIDGVYQRLLKIELYAEEIEVDTVLFKNLKGE